METESLQHGTRQLSNQSKLMESIVNALIGLVSERPNFGNPKTQSLWEGELIESRPKPLQDEKI